MRMNKSLIILSAMFLLAVSFGLAAEMRGPNCTHIPATDNCPVNYVELYTMTDTANAHPGNISADVFPFNDPTIFKFKVCCGGLGYDNYDFGLRSDDQGIHKSIFMYTYGTDNIMLHAAASGNDPVGAPNRKEHYVSTDTLELNCIPENLGPGLPQGQCDVWTHEPFVMLTDLKDAHVGSPDDSIGELYGSASCCSVCEPADDDENVCKICYNGTWETDPDRYLDVDDVSKVPLAHRSSGDVWNCCGNSENETWVTTGVSSSACCDNATDQVYYNGSHYICATPSEFRNITGYIFQKEKFDMTATPSVGALVEVKWVAWTSVVNSVRTDATGYYSIPVPNIPGKMYSVVASKSGYNSASKENVEVWGSNVEINLTILRGSGCMDISYNDCSAYNSTIGAIVCDPNCYNRGDNFGCIYDESSTSDDGRDIKEICAGKQEGWVVRDFNSTHVLSCCNSFIDKSSLYQNARITVETGIEDVESITVPMNILGESSALMHILFWED